MRTVTPGTLRAATLFIMKLLLISVVLSEAVALGASDDRYVGMIARITTPDGDPNPDVRIVRSGNALAHVGQQTPLMPGDQVFVGDNRTLVVVLMFGSTEAITIRNRARSNTGDTGAASRGMPNVTADWIVPDPGIPGASSSLARWLGPLLKELDPALSLYPAGARGLNNVCYNDFQTNVPTKFQVPLIMAQQSYLLSGRRALLVVWQGGVPPFDVRLSAAGSDSVIQEAHVQDTCEVRFQLVDLEPGQYRLSVTDARGAVDAQDDLRVVEHGPSLPRELSKAELTPETLALYSATWLLREDGRSWAFEALQRVASLDCSSAAVQEWLRERGQSRPCSIPSKTPSRIQ